VAAEEVVGVVEVDEEGEEEVSMLMLHHQVFFLAAVAAWPKVGVRITLVVVKRIVRTESCHASYHLTTMMTSTTTTTTTTLIHQLQYRRRRQQRSRRNSIASYATHPTINIKVTASLPVVTMIYVGNVIYK
jgi:hypothetical protein